MPRWSGCDPSALWKSKLHFAIRASFPAEWVPPPQSAAAASSPQGALMEQRRSFPSFSEKAAAIPPGWLLLLYNKSHFPHDTGRTAPTVARRVHNTTMIWNAREPKGPTSLASPTRLRLRW